MADIFISYSRKDLSRVRVLADALSMRGWSVWWDREIPAGRTFDDVIGEALAHARCVLVVWSKDSIASNWVREEADDGRRRGILIPVLIDEARPPFGFSRIQAVDLADWNGLHTAEMFQKLVVDIAAILGGPQAPGVTTAPPGRDSDDRIRDPSRSNVKEWRLRKPLGWSIAAAVVLVLVALGMYALKTRASDSSQPRSTTEPSTESGLRLYAVLNEGGEVLKRGVRYAVYERAVTDVEGNRKPVVSSAAYEGPPRFPLPTGRYSVAAEYGRASASTEVEVNSKTVTIQILNLRAGILNLSSMLATGSAPLANGVSYVVQETVNDAEGNRKPVVSSPAYEGPPRFPLPAGRYYVTAAYGKASASTEVEVKEGEIKSERLDLQAGILNLSCMLAAGSSPLTTGVSYVVEDAVKDAEGNRKRVVGSPTYEGPPRFPLPAGRYYVTGVYGSASASTEVEVKPGEIKSERLDLGAGILNLSSILAVGGPPLTTGVTYVVYEAVKDAEGNRKRVVASPAYEGPPRLPLPAGRYFVTAASGAGKGSAEIAVAKGAVQVLQVRLSR